MPPKGHEIEERISKASQAMDKDPTLKGTKAAQRFGAPYDRLMARRRGRPPSHSRGGQNKKLSTPQDDALKEYIIMLQYSRRGANLEEVRAAAGRLLFWESGDPKASVSRRWAKAWMSRQSNFLKSIKEKPLSAKRLAAHIVEDVKGHFEEFARCKQRYSVKDEDISNFDESGFQIGVVTGDQVYVSLDCEAIYNADPDNRELVTAVATVNYGGRKVPAMIIFKGAYHLRRHFKNDLDGNILFARSATRFTNDRLGIAYIKHFDRFCPSSQRGRYRILIFDGHGSHISNDFLDYCWQHRIRPYKLLAHTTHLLQPLDVAVFQALKH
jgi:hypothetical protein